MPATDLPRSPDPRRLASALCRWLGLAVFVLAHGKHEGMWGWMIWPQIVETVGRPDWLDTESIGIIAAFLALAATAIPSPFLTRVLEASRIARAGLGLLAVFATTIFGYWTVEESHAILVLLAASAALTTAGVFLVPVEPAPGADPSSGPAG